MGRKQTDETKRRISASLKGRKSNHGFKRGYDPNRYTQHKEGCQCPWHNSATRYVNKTLKYTLEEILVENSPITRGTIKRRILKEGLLEEKCYECGLGTVWNGKPLVLEIDHINGDWKDNRLENLRFLCHNCHSQTETWKFKKRGPVAQLADAVDLKPTS